MRRFYLYSICLLTLIVLNINFVKADVLGPYIMDSNVPATPAGYDRIVFPLNNVSAPVIASIAVSDESGKQYELIIVWANLPIGEILRWVVLST